MALDLSPEFFEMTIDLAIFFFFFFLLLLSEKNLQEFSICLYFKCFSTDQNFANNFSKKSPEEHFCEIISKSNQGFQKRRLFKNFFMSV